jgi:hypothetical protein
LHPHEKSVFQISLVNPENPFSLHWVGRCTGAVIGFFENKQEAALKVIPIDQDGVNPSGIYVPLNLVPGGDVCSSNGKPPRMKAWNNGATSDEKITAVSS